MKDAKTALESAWANVRVSASGYEGDHSTLMALKIACLSGYREAVVNPSEFSAEDISSALVEIIVDELKKLMEDLRCDV